MIKTIVRAVMLAALAGSMAPIAPAFATPGAGSGSVCRERSTTMLNFFPGTVPFPDGTNLSNEFARSGVVFSGVDSDLPPEYQQSFGGAGPLVQDGRLTNLFRLEFTTEQPVVRVTVTLSDSNGVRQSHSLTAFDGKGRVVDRATFTEHFEVNSLFPDRFTLTVSACAGIAYVVAIESPLGAEVLEQISFTTGHRMGDK